MKLPLQTIILSFFCVFGLNAQDLHFTQFDLTPLHVNPANVGGFPGSFRVGGLYRDQAFSVDGFGSDFSTINFYLDATFNWGLRKKDWVGFGMNFLQDRSGVIGLGSGSFIAQGAYHLGLRKGSDLALGVQYGGVGYNIKNKDLGKNEAELITAGGGAADLAKLQDKANYTDISIGLNYTASVTARKHQLKIGVSAARINNPKVTLSSGQSINKLGSLLTANLGYQYHYSEKLDLTPMLWVRNVKSFNTIVPQCMASYLFNVEKGIRLNAGLGYRIGDALQVMFGVDIKKVKVQIGYDQTLSSQKLAQSPKGVGALELGVCYIGTVVKKPNPKPRVFCPRF
jgi:type IX secretion system PorP/SprF family membrane protein